MSVCKGWKTIFFPKVYTLKFNNRHSRKNSKSSGEDGQVAHSILAQFKAHADGWEINMLSTGAFLSKKKNNKKKPTSHHLKRSVTFTFATRTLRGKLTTLPINKLATIAPSIRAAVTERRAAVRHRRSFPLTSPSKVTDDSPPS